MQFRIQMKILNCIFLWCVGITLTPLPTPRPAFNSLKVTWMLCTKPAKVFRKNILRKIFSAKILCTPKNCIWYKIVVGRFAKFHFRFGSVCEFRFWFGSVSKPKFRSVIGQYISVFGYPENSMKKLSGTRGQLCIYITKIWKTLYFIYETSKIRLVKVTQNQFSSQS